MKSLEYVFLRLGQAAWGIAIAILALTLHPSLALSRESPPPLDPRNPSWVYFAQNPVPLPVIDRLRQDLAQRTGKSAAQFRVAAATAQAWPDGCLGLGKPDELCTQALVSGWRVTLVFGKQQWVYRTNAQGSSLRLESAPTSSLKKTP